MYDKNIRKFLISIPQIGANATLGAVEVMDPITGAIQKTFTGTNNCLAAGMAKGPRDNVLVGCDPGFPAPGLTFTAHTYVINDRSGAIVADITQVGGEDEVWYDPGNRRYYTGSRDFFTNPAAAAATPVLGVIDAETNQWIENVPTGTNAHSVTANLFTNAIFVPLEDPNQVCGAIPGCLGIYHEDLADRWGRSSLRNPKDSRREDRIRRTLDGAASLIGVLPRVRQAQSFHAGLCVTQY